MSHHSTPRSAFSQKQQVISNLDENNDSFLEQSNSFDLKNQIYELTSKYNNLEYEKNKILISYENVLKEQKQKYAILERLCSEKQEKEEKLNTINTELKTKCAYLTEENDALKKELHSLFEKNRITPDFNTIEMAQEMNMLGDLLEKEERVQKLDRQLQDAKESEYAQLREKVASLQKENRRLKEQKLDLQAQKEETIKKATRDVEEYHKGIIKFKDNTIRKLEEEQMALSMQLDQARQASLQRNSQKSQEYAQHRRKEEKIEELQEKYSLSQKQRMRVQAESNDLQEDNRRLESQRKMLEKSKKSLQEEIFHLTNQISQVRAASFNDKIQCKKQVNSIKVQMQEEKHKLRSFIEQKGQQNKRLRESILTLNDENQQLRDKLGSLAKQIERIHEQNHQLAKDNEKYLREGNRWQDFGKESNSPANNRQQEEKIYALEKELNAYKNQLRSAAQSNSQLQAELQNCLSEINIKQQLVELMKIQKMDYDSKTKEAARKLKQHEQSKVQKQKVIQNLQGQIRNLKDEIRQLELANEQLSERLQMMKNINSQVQNIKHQLQLEKQYYEQMRKEEQELRRKHKRSQQFKAQQSSRQFRSQPIPGQSEHSMKANSIEHSRMKQAQMSKEMEHLRVQNYDLQIRINEYQNEISKKGIDINMKQEQNRKLKEMLSNPREMNYQPIVQTSKKTQFNAVFLQNKILLLQKEILGIKNLKEKEYEEYKKVYRKKIQEKYHAQMSRTNLYNSELQKNIDLLSNKLQREQKTSAQLKAKVDQLTKLNYDIKFDYSQALQELNSLLQRYKELQGKHKQPQFDRNQMRKVIEQNNRLRAYVQKINKTTQQRSLKLTNAHGQIQKLNQTLMIKQSEIKFLKLTSPNSSFIGSNRSEQKSGLLNIPVKQDVEMMHPSSDTDSLHSWIKKSPNYSRV